MRSSAIILIAIAAISPVFSATYPQTYGGRSMATTHDDLEYTPSIPRLPATVKHETSYPPAPMFEATESEPPYDTYDESFEALGPYDDAGMIAYDQDQAVDQPAKVAFFGGGIGKLVGNIAKAALGDDEDDDDDDDDY